MPDSLLLAVGLIVGATAAGLAFAYAIEWWRGSSSARRTRGNTRPLTQGPPSWIDALSKTRGSLGKRLIEAWHGPGEGDRWLAEAEEILLTADVGVKATPMLLATIRSKVRGIMDPSDLQALLRQAVCEILAEEDAPPAPDGKPWVILVVGVNGVGKTTTIGKLALYHRTAGRKVLLVAGDTFRAAAIEQLSSWGERVGVPLIKHQHGADPSAVAFDGMRAAIARQVDVVIVDTAGRLHVKENLMEELKKIGRTIGRQVDGAPHEVLLVVDATTGQNALSQARVFHEALGVTGVALTKLDGTAKGGIALAIRSEFGLPIRFVGLGERSEDLAEFDADSFAEALFATPTSGESLEAR